MTRHTYNLDKTTILKIDVMALTSELTKSEIVTASVEMMYRALEVAKSNGTAPEHITTETLKRVSESMSDADRAMIESMMNAAIEIVKGGAFPFLSARV